MWQQIGLALALAGGTDGIEWRSDLTAAQEEACRSRRPLFVVFRCER